MQRGPPQSDPSDPAAPPRLIGIGASAGGIEALIALFEAMPLTTKAAFLVVLHLDPTRKSGLSDLLAKHTALTVVEARDGARIEADHIYIIAPDASLTVDDGLVLSQPPRARRGHRNPVDVLFSSLALQDGPRSICIVLSGSGDDGAEGVKAIKRAGGHVIVQAPASAKVDSMPAAAIATTFADDILPPEAIPDRLATLLNETPGVPATSRSPATDGIDALLAFVDLRTGSNFCWYKRAPLARRIRRRMSLLGVRSVGAYIELLKREPDEITALRQDLLINVTSFERDIEAWTSLVAPIDELLATREAGSAVRAWVVGCASGEEAFTLAMLLCERAQAIGKTFDIKIFATDLREDGLAIARAGAYPASAVAALSPERQKRFFDPCPDGVRVKKAIRDLIVFAEHDLLVDPPFSKLDIVSCRNVLIYLDRDAQTRALALFHFGLREGGVLFLGAAETVGLQSALFETISKKWRIFRKTGATRYAFREFPPKPSRAKAASQRGTSVSNSTVDSARLADIARRALLTRFAPASVLIDRSGKILWFHGETGDFLAQPPGEPSSDVFAMARDGLRVKLRNAMRRATEEKKPVTFEATLSRTGAPERVSVTVAPATGASGKDDLFLISFEPLGSAPLDHPAVASEGHPALSVGADEELRIARAELQDTIEQFEATNERLKAANDEVSSINEELQSANEELETSKEEMQSFNEELQTVNSELQHKVEELEEARDALNNFSNASEVATLFLDPSMRIRWYSPTSEDLLGLGQADIGRAISGIDRRLVDQLFIAEAENVLRTARGVDSEVEGDAGRWFLRRLRPYRTHDGPTGGVVATFMDVTERKLANDAVIGERLFSDAIVETVRHPLIVLDRDLRVQSVNPAFAESFDCAAPQSVGLLISQLDHGAWDIPELRRQLLDVVHGDSKIEGFKIAHSFPRLGERHMRLNARKLVRGGERTELILVAIEDVTAQINLDEQRDLIIGELRHRMKNMLAMVNSIIGQTMRGGGLASDVREALDGRLKALGSAYDLLISNDWTGSDLSETAHRALAPYSTDRRLKIQGPPQRVDASASVSLALVLNELATNAIKYGALSSPSGVVRVSWALGEETPTPHLHLLWVEEGGPPVPQKISRGFGTNLIERSVTHQLEGRVDIDLNPKGLACRISFPIKRDEVVSVDAM